jgi:hypothetical protein
MLRSLLGVGGNTNNEDLFAAETAQTLEAMGRFIARAWERAGDSAVRGVRNAGLRKYALWAQGLRRSYVELAESRFAAEFFASRLTAGKNLYELMPEERLDYDRYIYFDKNAYIRIFAILDKLGSLMNEMLHLRTERVKSRFSYFTVLRNMRCNHLHPELAHRLGAVKDRHRDAMDRLRTRRNMEIHYMNAELYDDVRYTTRWEKEPLEDLAANIADLGEGYAMVSQSLRHAVSYLKKQME